MRLDLFDLQLFLHIVATGSLTRGAQRSALSLQAASERIKKLEQQFAVPLFSRHATGVRLTLAGQTFAEQAQRLIQQGQQLEQMMLPFSQGLNAEVSLWCNSSAQSEYLPGLLSHYLAEHPQIRIELKEAESHDIIQALQKGQALLGLVSSFFDSQDLQTLEFSEDPLVLICPLTHALTRYPRLALAETLTAPFVGLMAYHSLQQSIETQARLLGCQMAYRLRLPNFAAIAQAVANGVGVAIMPRRAALRLQPHYQMHIVALEGAWANRKLLLAARSFADLPGPYQHFSQFLLQQKASTHTTL